MENAETVIRCHKRFHNLVVCRIGCLRNALCRRATEPEVVFIVIIELYAVIRAGFRYRAAPVRTSSRRAFGRIFFSEIRQISERRYLLAGLADDPLDYVDVVTAFRKEHGSCFLFAVPVAADKAVTEMNIADSFERDDGHYIAYIASVNDFFYFFIERGVTQNVADDDLDALFVRRFCNACTFLNGLCDGLFEENIISEGDCLHCRTVMHIVHGCDYCDVRKFRSGKNFFPAFIAVFGRKIKILAQNLSRRVDRISHADELKFFGHFCHYVGIGSASAARAYANCRKLFHNSLPL